MPNALFSIPIGNDDGILNEAEIASLNQYRVQIAAVIEHFNVEAARIRNDKGLNAVGIADHLGQAGKVAAEKLTGISSHLDTISRRIAEEERELFEAMSELPKDSAVAEMRQAEIRAHLAKRANLDIGAALIEAAEAEDIELIAAVLAAPKILLAAFQIPVGQLDQAKRTVAERRRPAAAKTLRELRTMKAALASDLRTAFGRLEAAGAITRDDPLQRVARDGQLEVQREEDNAAHIRRELDRIIG